MLVEQQATAAEAERRAEAEALLGALARQSVQEQQLAERLWQLGQEQEVRGLLRCGCIRLVACVCVCVCKVQESWPRLGFM
jgi:hypothetical protein